MAAQSRQKACMTCADSKRSCDKQLPKCRRCLTKDVDCIYPSRKRARGNSTAEITLLEGRPNLHNPLNDNSFGGLLDLDIWNPPDTSVFEGSLGDLTELYAPIPTLPSTQLPGFDAAPDNSNATGSGLWFLQDETWTMVSCRRRGDNTTYPNLEPIIRAAEEMLQCWVRNGHNSFIHWRLYEKSMPSCLQDAFTTLAAYNSRSAAMKDTILQIADARASALISQGLPVTDGVKGLLEHLARVQSLFVYEFIRLFDSSLRSRVLAEHQLSTLRRWVIQMWEAVKRLNGDRELATHQHLMPTAAGFEDEHEAALQVWQIWILTESVRRSHIIIDLTMNVYEAITKGWVDCLGAFMFTASHGLWDARSPLRWLELSRVKPPLMIRPTQLGLALSHRAADEVDELTKTLWSILGERDKIQSWIDRGGVTSA